MKIRFKTFILLLFITSSAFSKDGFLIGLKAGANFTTLSGDFGAADPSMKIGYHFGLTADIRISNKFALSPELLYTTKGIWQNLAGIDVNGNLAYIEESITLNYVEIPLLAKLKLQNGLHFDLGPYIGLLNSVDYHASVATDSISYIIDTTLTNAFAPVDFGIIAGVGYQFSEDLGVNLRYEYGISDVNKNGISNLYANRAIALSLNCFF